MLLWQEVHIFDNDVMCVLGTKYARTPAQIGLRWAIQKGISVSEIHQPGTNPQQWKHLDFNIEDEDMAIIDTLNEDRILLMFQKISVIFSFNFHNNAKKISVRA